MRFLLGCLCLFTLASLTVSTCTNLNIGTSPRVQDIVRMGIVSKSWDPSSNSTFYAHYDHSTDYLYVSFEGTKLDASSLSVESESGFKIAYKFLPGVEPHLYSIEILYICDTLFARPYVINLKLKVPGCGEVHLKWRKICRLLFNVQLNEAGTKVDLVKGGSFIYRVPGRSPEEVNSFSVGIPVLASHVELLFSTSISSNLRKEILSSEDRAKADQTLKSLESFGIQQARVIYDSEQLEISYSSFLVNQDVNFDIKCRGNNQFNLVEFVLDIDKYSSYSLYFKKVCAEGPTPVSAVASASFPAPSPAPTPASLATSSPTPASQSTQSSQRPKSPTVSIFPLQDSHHTSNSFWSHFSFFGFIAELFWIILYTVLIALVGICIFVVCLVGRYRTGAAALGQNPKITEDPVELSNLKGRSYGTLM